MIGKITREDKWILGVLTVCVVLAFIGLQSSRLNQISSDCPQDYQWQPPTQSPKDQGICLPTAPLSTFESSAQAKQGRCKPQYDGRPTLWPCWWPDSGDWQAIFDFVLICVGYLQWRTYTRQAGIMEGQRKLSTTQTKISKRQTSLIYNQLKVAITSAAAAEKAAIAAENSARSDRPWLFMEEVSYEPFVRKTHGEIFNTKIFFKVRNVGRTPAIITKISARFFWVAKIGIFAPVDPERPVVAPIYEARMVAPAMEQGVNKTYPFEDSVSTFVFRMESNATIAANSSTNIIEVSGYFSRPDTKATIEGLDDALIQREASTGTKYCLLVVNYLDLRMIECVTSYYARIGRVGFSASGVRDDLDKKHNYWK